MLFFLLLAFPAAVWAQSADIEIEPVRTSITVRETLEAESSGYVTAVDAEALDSRPGVNIDDRLRDIPGFSLFRRSSSLVAHPTTQGVSLRGIGSSAAGRTLVLYDGFPANDPFGGWVYWSRMNPDAVEVIEVSRGATTSAYGDRAHGGGDLGADPYSRRAPYLGFSRGRKRGDRRRPRRLYEPVREIRRVEFRARAAFGRLLHCR